ncbi:hypothetical protein [Chlamydiifrater phoenicopteri]|uniref:hypothetical protein n=1 Tax=Chlamydiifrater phoenicopteri TaxID=2681469 RepID=UPI001BCE8B8A|nr:hypothetical protein [Chlamydiifrater phoenicopteri]
MRVIFPNKQQGSHFFSKIFSRVPLALLLFSCTAPIASYILKKIFHTSGLLELFSLSKNSIDSHRIWQFFTYPLICSDSINLSVDASLELSQRLLLRNTLVCILLQKISRHFIQKLGTTSFLVFLGIQIPCVGAAVWSLMKLTGSNSAFFGAECILCALATVSVFLDPEKRFYLRPFPFYISRKWGFLIVLGVFFLSLIACKAFFFLGGAILSVLLSILFCQGEKLPNPYATFNSFSF